MALPFRLAVAFLVTCGASEGAARAHQDAPMRETPTAVAGLSLVPPSQVETTLERLDVRCEEREVKPVCRLRATYVLTNPRDAAVEVSGSFRGARAEEVIVTLDGKDVRTQPEGEVLFRATLGPTQRGALVVEGPFRPFRAWNLPASGGLAVPAYQARHPLLSSPDHRDAHFELLYHLPPSPRSGEPHPATITLDTPKRWRRQQHATSSPGPAEPRAVTLELELPPPLLLNGGPFVGAGVAFGDAHGLRLRAGYEVAPSRWLITSLAVETDVRRHHDAALLVEAASPNLAFFIPSAALGLGPVVAHRPNANDLGARVQLTLSVLYVSAVLHTDLFPGQREPVRWTLLGQLSF